MKDDAGQGETGTRVGLALIKNGNGDGGVEFCGGNDLHSGSVRAIAKVDAVGQDPGDALLWDWRRRRLHLDCGWTLRGDLSSGFLS